MDTNITTINADAPLAEEINSFFAQFEARKPTVPPPAYSTSLTLQQQEVRSVLRQVNQRKAAGPSGIPGRLHVACADKLSGILTTILNLSLTQAIVPTSLKTATIIPILSNYRPSGVMKCFERLVLRHIQACLVATLYPINMPTGVIAPLRLPLLSLSTPL